MIRLDKVILVTGGVGFIGSHELINWLMRVSKVRIINSLSSGRCENLKHLINKIEMLIGNLKKQEDIYEAMNNIGTVFHFAANPRFRVSTTTPKIHFNKNIFSLCLIC